MAKRIKAQYPYDKYFLYIVHHEKENRNYANLIPIDKKSGLKRKTISYARYLMSIKEGRILDSSEHVDHIDDDKTNDELNNLQILTLEENNKKEGKRRGSKMVILRCPFCNIIFEKRKGQTHLQKGGNYTSCSRTCSSSFAILMQNEPNSEKVLSAIRNNVIREYIKHS